MSQGIQSDTYNYESEDDWNPVPSNRPLQMSHEIQLDPSSNQSDDDESEVISKPVPSNRHLQVRQVLQNRPHIYLFHANTVEIGLSLYEASIKCDWKATEAILDEYPDVNFLRRSITENGETALHIAASSKAPKKKVDEFVRNLVERMELKDLKLENNNQSTALYLAAAAGNIETVKIMMKKYPTLDTIPGGGGDMMPLYAAVLFGNKDVAKYLYKSSEDLGKGGWNDENRSSLLEKCVESDMFDIAIQIVKEHGNLGVSSNLLGLLARKHEAFSEKKSNIIKRTIKSGKHP